MSAADLPWLQPLQQQLRASLQAERLPHAVLLSSVAGLGAERLAEWLTALVLCDSAARPCNSCASCLLLRAATHPDRHVVRIEEDAKQIKVDQIRDLIEALALKSYRGGYKVGVIEGAEALNVNGANAFLKTLEEPGDGTLLVMVARPTHRLPATVASRCLRMVVRPPRHGDAVDWLVARGATAQTADAALLLAAGAPLLAQELSAFDLGKLEADMRDGVRLLGADSTDVSVLAEQWARSHLGLRLAWLENWITRRVHNALGGEGSAQTAERVRLPAALLKPKIRALFDFLDAARELRRLASTSMNQQLALEALLLNSRSALAN